MAAPSVALVPVPAGACPSCGADTIEVVCDELPLVRHGGYGATRRTTIEACPRASVECDWALTRQVQEVRP